MSWASSISTNRPNAPRSGGRSIARRFACVGILPRSLVHYVVLTTLPYTSGEPLSFLRRNATVAALYSNCRPVEPGRTPVWPLLLVLSTACAGRAGQEGVKVEPPRSSEIELSETRSTPAEAAAGSSDERMRALLDQFGASHALRPPKAKNVMEMVEAPILTVGVESVSVDDTPLAVAVDAFQDLRIRWLPNVASIFGNKRDLWLAINPSKLFHGVALLQIDARVRASLVKSVIYTLALAGYPNLSLVVKTHGPADDWARLPVDGRVPGLASWKDQAPPTWLVVEVTPGNTALTWWRRNRSSLESRMETPFATLSREVVRRWQLLGPNPSEEATSHRAMARFRNETQCDTIVRVIDAVSEPQRWFELSDGERLRLPAFLTVVAANPGELDVFIGQYQSATPAR